MILFDSNSELVKLLSSAVFCQSILKHFASDQFAFCI